MSKTQIVVSGSIAIDRIMTFSGHYKDLIEPAKLHVISVGVLVDSSQIAQGGIGANISHNLASLGGQPVLLGSVGEDATDYIKKLSDLGVDTSSVHFSKLGTASFNVLNDSDGNQVGGFYPGAMSDADSLSFKPWAGQDTLFWIAPHDPAAMRRQVEECRAGNLKLGYDPGQQVVSISADDLRAGIEAAEIFMINEYELEVVTKKTGLTAEQLTKTVPLFVTTRGENGSIIAGTSLGEPIEIPAVKRTKVVDPGGAGDAYRGGFLHGYLQQWDLRQCGQLGATVASFVIEEFGPQIDFDLAKIAERYKENFNEEIKL
jgi:adenosine kinase